MKAKIQSIIALLILMSFATSFIVNGNPAGTAPEPERTTKSRFPILFETNAGQSAPEVRFIARGGGYTAYMTAEGVDFQLKRVIEDAQSDVPKTPKKIRSDSLSMEFVGANNAPAISGESEAVTKTNYYIGDKRLENLSNFHKVGYRGLYDGIDAVFYGNESGQIEYDFNVSPNADPSAISLGFKGAKSLSIDESGNLLIETENTTLVQEKPIAHQIIDGNRVEVDAAFSLKNDNTTVGFSLGEYDRALPLVIDPALNYLTYIGGTAFDDTFEVAADSDGNAYVSGDTQSLNFHGEARAEQDGSAVYVAKIRADGSVFDYITILEGNGDDLGGGITVDAAGQVFVVGQATRDFPVTTNAFDTNLGGGGDGFVAKLNAGGNLVYATYIGGNAGDDLAFDVAADSAGKAYVVGRTISGLSFPQKNRYQGCGAGLTFNSYDAFLTVVNAQGTDITYSSCIGGNLTSDAAFSVALDPSNNAYMTGLTSGGNFPTKNAFQSVSGGGQDGFVAKFNPAASGEASLVYSTYLGGVGTDQGNAIAVNSSGQAHVVGLTGSVNFPLLNPIDSTNQVNEGFVTVLSSTGTSLINSTFLGGSSTDQAINVALDPTGTIYVTGETASNDFPVVLPFQAARRGQKDAFVTKLKFGRGIIGSSYLGGTGNDGGKGVAVSGNFIFVVGDTESSNLLTTAQAPVLPLKATSNASSTNPDGFFAKILDTRVDSVGVFRPASAFLLTQSTTNVVQQNANLTAGLAGERGVSGDWNGDGIDTIGSFSSGTWKIRDANFTVFNLPVKTITFGTAGDLPVVGDWDNDGIDTPGVFRPSTGQFFLTNSTSTAPPIDLTVNFGTNGDLPVAGDWDANGFDTVGVYRPSQTTFFLTNNFANASIDRTVFLGVAEDLPTAGDWNGDGVDTVGLWRPSTAQFFLSDDLVTISRTFVFGQTGDQPIVGDWDGKP